MLGYLLPEGTEALRYSGNLSIAHQAAIKPRDAAVGENVADGVVDRGVGAAVVRAVIAFNVKRLRGLRESPASSRQIALARWWSSPPAWGRRESC